MLFPALQGKPVCRIDLDREAERWLARQNLTPADRNPLLDPAVCQRLLDDFHRRHNVAWSYGGYLEDRRHVWRGSYLDRTESYVHLGVDFHVAQGTAVVTEFDADIALVENDSDTDGGWGERIFLRLGPAVAAPPALDVLLIYAHLQNVAVRPGAHLRPGTLLAEVGGPPDNGNWSPHLHIQAIQRAMFEDILLNRFTELDGYGRCDRRDELNRQFPDPLDFVHVV